MVDTLGSNEGGDIDTDALVNTVPQGLLASAQPSKNIVWF
jgi:hypothetical protein